MKKRSFTSKLYLKKHKIAFLTAKTLIGGLRTSDDTHYETLGKQSTCPIDTCTCETVPTEM